MSRMERKIRRQEKAVRRAQRREEIKAGIERYAQDILQSRNFKKTEEFIQHGSVSVQKHCLSVAECSVRIKEKLEKIGIHCQEKDLVRGALLHDYFLYDWHKNAGQDHRRLHGFYHPGVALANASREYRLSPREKDIIVKHMWPLTVRPPRCREAWIVTAADKYCSLKETLLQRGKKR